MHCLWKKVCRLGLLLTAVAPTPSNWQSTVVAETGKALHMHRSRISIGRQSQPYTMKYFKIVRLLRIIGHARGSDDFYQPFSPSVYQLLDRSVSGSVD